MTTTPTTPEACRAEQERVLTLLEGITPEEWLTAHYPSGSVVYVEREPNPGEHFAEGETPALLIAENATRFDAALIAAAPALARNYAALIAAHAEALADLELLRTNRDQLAADNETLSTWNAALEAEMRGYRASRNAPHAEALERERVDFFSVDWATMPTETQDCPNWGRQAGGHFGPCGKCPACWLNQNMDALKELKEVNDKQRAEIIARDTIALVGTHGYAMNGPEEGELCEVLPTGEYRVLSSGEVKSITDAPGGEVYFLSERLPAQAPASAGGAE